MNVPTIRVYYEHICGERVFRSFYTRDGARKFIDANALVYPLPDVCVTEVVIWSPFEEIEIEV